MDQQRCPTCSGSWPADEKSVIYELSRLARRVTTMQETLNEFSSSITQILSTIQQRPVLSPIPSDGESSDRRPNVFECQHPDCRNTRKTRYKKTDGLVRHYTKHLKDLFECTFCKAKYHDGNSLVNHQEVCKQATDATDETVDKARMHVRDIKERARQLLQESQKSVSVKRRMPSTIENSRKVRVVSIDNDTGQTRQADVTAIVSTDTAKSASLPIDVAETSTSITTTGGLHLQTDGSLHLHEQPMAMYNVLRGGIVNHPIENHFEWGIQNDNQELSWFNQEQHR